MYPHFVTTAFELNGYRITKALGVVRGITVRSRSIIGNIGAIFQTLISLVYGQSILSLAYDYNKELCI